MLIIRVSCQVLLHLRRTVLNRRRQATDDQALWKIGRGQLRAIVTIDKNDPAAALAKRGMCERQFSQPLLCKPVPSELGSLKWNPCNRCDICKLPFLKLCRGKAQFGKMSHRTFANLVEPGVPLSP